jgi:aspartate carbamoyltransferase catalytic subunit
VNDLTGIETLSAQEILGLLDSAERFRGEYASGRRRWTLLEGKSIALLFYEPSTRTRFSFELAARRLSADVLAFSASTSSVRKGETLRDTLRNLEAMGVDAFVVRHPESGAALECAAAVTAPVINAGDGAHEHPTQALLDFMTIRQHRKTLQGLKVVYVGDVLHSRVARSGLFGLRTLGSKVALCGPPTLVPDALAELGAEVHHDLRRALRGADAVVGLRIQRERQQASFLPSVEEYARYWQLTPETVGWAKPDCLVLHPGPLNRGVEISDEVADRRSVILDQVSNGVFLRMAVLSALLCQKVAATFEHKRVKRSHPV